MDERASEPAHDPADSDPRILRIEDARRRLGITRAAAADLVDRNELAAEDDISPEILRLPTADRAADDTEHDPPRAA